MKDLLHSLGLGTNVSAVLIAVATFFILYLLGIENWVGISFSVLTGLAAGVIIGQATEYYTSQSYKPTQKISEASQTGPATVIIKGIGTGMISTCIPVFTIAVAIVLSYLCANGFHLEMNAQNMATGLYGIGIAAVGMLSTLGITLATDAYGPIADNAGGNAEMCELGEEYASQAAVIEHMGQFGADPIPEAHAIEEPGEHAAQAAADEGIDHDGPQTACRLAEPVLLRDDDGDYRDHDAQHAVISGGPVADAVDEVDEIAYHDAGDIAPQGGHQHGAQPVQIQGEAQPGCQDAAQAVDQYADGAEEQQLQQAHSRARPEFLIMLFHVLTSGQVAPQGAQEAEGLGENS